MAAGGSRRKPGAEGAQPSPHPHPEHASQGKAAPSAQGSPSPLLKPRAQDHLLAEPLLRTFQAGMGMGPRPHSPSLTNASSPSPPLWP